MAAAASLMVSFIGTGTRDPHTKRGGYRTAKYRFPPEDAMPASPPDETPLFAGALLRRLHALGRPPNRWLVLGTAQSNWDNLENALPENALETFLKSQAPLYNQVRSLVDKGCATDESLVPWAQALSAALKLSVSLRVVGPCDTPKSQNLLMEALDQAIQDGDQVAIDITHGLRHMPLLTVSMALLLRRIRRQPPKLVFYYGAFELADGGLCPVLKLDLPNSLAQAAEALSVERYTGSLAALAEVLPASLRSEVARAAFRHGIGRFSANAARDLLKRIQAARTDHPAERAALNALRARLEPETTGSSYASLMRRGVQHIQDSQFLKAAIFLFESVNALALQHFPSKDVRGDFDDRVRDARQQLFRRATQNQKRSIEHLRRIRNALVHGPHAGDPWIDTVLAKEQGLADLLRDCADAIRDLAAHVEGTR